MNRTLGLLIAVLGGIAVAVGVGVGGASLVVNDEPIDQDAAVENSVDGEQERFSQDMSQLFLYGDRDQ